MLLLLQLSFLRRSATAPPNACPLRRTTTPALLLPSAAAAPSPSPPRWAALPLARRTAASRAPRPGGRHPCRARRRARYYGDDDEEEGRGHNGEIAMIESYSAGARGVALLVHAAVDGEEETVLVFKGFSSLLSSVTTSDPAKSVLPARAVIRAVDVVRGPFDPSNIEYLERDLPWDAFKTRIQQGKP
ncbi:hypothetical protein Taro_036445 [Colocasia esculenta]|uniref:DUF7734 domain-containing protein n=1 Tax=Colocasia esculenta TaxID=4460 RepID=A0A843WHV5_COLES|nr:hypothetical protein [Colocasia esculenta]